MTTDFIRRLWRPFLATALATIAAPLPEAPGEPPFVRADLVIHHRAREKGEQSYRPENRRPVLTIARRNRRPVNLGIELNGDLDAATAARRDVRVAVLGPRENRRAAYRYFFHGANVSGQVTTGNFSGFVDPGFNVGNLTVQVVPKKKRPARRKGTIAAITVRAFDLDAGQTVDSVRGLLRKK